MSGLLLDTNVISEPTREWPDPRVRDWFRTIREETAYLSALTIGEIRRGIESLPLSAKRSRLELWLQDVYRRFVGRILPVDEAVAERWGEMTARAEAMGRTLPGTDSLIAATALEHNLTFVTRDANELATTGVRLFNPWKDEF
jgi:predicted nucleic acid-binding protein